MKKIKHIALNTSDIVISVTPSKETEKAAFYTVWNIKNNTFMDVWIPRSLLKINETSAEVPTWFFAKTFGKFLHGFEKNIN